jgi:4-aminobutyrate aminotransferase-like enzyme
LCILGAGENTLRLSPPLLIGREQADAALAILEQCIQEVEGKV